MKTDSVSASSADSARENSSEALGKGKIPRLVAGFALSALLIAECIPEHLIGIFTDDSAVISCGATGLRFVAASLVLLPFPLLLGATLQASKRETTFFDILLRRPFPRVRAARLHPAPRRRHSRYVDSLPCRRGNCRPRRRGLRFNLSSLPRRASLRPRSAFSQNAGQSTLQRLK